MQEDGKLAKEEYKETRMGDMFKKQDKEDLIP